MSNRRVLVSGGGGFIGSHLCERLLERGDQVYCIDNFSTGRIANVAHLRSHARFRLLIRDIVQPLDFDVIEVDAIYNLASPASPAKYRRDPEGTLLANVYGTHNLLRMAERKKARFFQASASEIYGDPNVHPQVESYWGNVNTVGPRSCYDESKRCAETLCYIHRVHRGLDVTIARIFNTYGPRMQSDDGRVVSNFIVQALRNDPITIYGTGEQTRSFCYVDDLVDLVERLMNVPELPAGPINVGNPSEITVLELAEQIVAMAGSRSPIVHEPLPRDDPMRRCPDISVARTLGWKPRCDLKQGLLRTIAYFEGVLARARSPEFAAAGAS
jgi:UDP-glucuronate decarboxylase